MILSGCAETLELVSECRREPKHSENVVYVFLFFTKKSVASG